MIFYHNFHILFHHLNAFESWVPTMFQDLRISCQSPGFGSNQVALGMTCG
jgi:hypothetical protein